VRRPCRFGPDCACENLDIPPPAIGHGPRASSLHRECGASLASSRSEISGKEEGSPGYKTTTDAAPARSFPTQPAVMSGGLSSQQSWFAAARPKTGPWPNYYPGEVRSNWNGLCRISAERAVRKARSTLAGIDESLDETPAAGLCRRPSTIKRQERRSIRAMRNGRCLLACHQALVAPRT